MGIIFAQVAPLTAPRQEIVWEVVKAIILLLVAAAVVLGVVMAVKSLWGRMRKPHSEEATRSPRIARVAVPDCLKQHQTIDGKLAELEAEDKRLQGEIALIKTGIGEMERRLNAADEERTSKIHQRLNDMPAQIVAGLLNSKKLFKE